jgi:hypothetical protein
MSSFAGISAIASGVPGGGQAILQGDRQIITENYPAPTNNLVAIAVPGEAIEEFGSSAANSNSYYSVGDYTYGYSGAFLTVYDTSDTSSFTAERSLAIDESVRTLLGQKDYLYAISTTAITVLDISDPLRPREIGFADVAADVLTDTDLQLNATVLHDDRLIFAWQDDMNTADGSDDEGGIIIYSVSDPTSPTYLGMLTQGSTVFSDYGSSAKHFENIAVTGHLAALSSGFSANGVPGTGGSEQYEGRIELFNIADPANIYKIKDILPDGGYVPSGTTDYPIEVHFFRNRYLFVFGRQDLSYFEL